MPLRPVLAVVAAGYLAALGYGAAQPAVPAMSEPLATELSHFLECVRAGKRPDTDGWNGARVVAVCEAVEVSLAAKGERVAVSLPSPGHGA